MKALILAGGFATRLWPLTTDKAKPLLPLAGKPIISHIIDKIPEHIPVIVSTNAVFKEDFYRWRETLPQRDITIFIEDAENDAGKKGALRAVGLVIEQFAIQEDLLVIGGDNVFAFDLQTFIDFADSVPTLAAFDVKDIEEAKKYGVVVADGNRIVDFQEKPPMPKSTLAGAACYVFPVHTLAHVVQTSKEMPDRLGGVFESLLANGFEPRVYAFDAYWNDIGSFHAYIEAHIAMGKGSVPVSLCATELQNTFEGVNYIDATVQLRESRVKDSIILAGCRIERCDIVGSIIDRDCEFQNLELTNEIVQQQTVLLNDGV